MIAFALDFSLQYEADPMYYVEHSGYSTFVCYKHFVRLLTWEIDARALCVCVRVCRVPEALQPFMPGRLSFIPFRKQLDPKTKKLVPITK